MTICNFACVFFRKRINISVTLVSESYVILYCKKNVICNSSIKNMFKKKRKKKDHMSTNCPWYSYLKPFLDTVNVSHISTQDVPMWWIEGVLFLHI